MNTQNLRMGQRQAQQLSDKEQLRADLLGQVADRLEAIEARVHSNVVREHLEAMMNRIHKTGYYVDCYVDDDCKICYRYVQAELDSIEAELAQIEEYASRIAEQRLEAVNAILDGAGQVTLDDEVWDEQNQEVGFVTMMAERVRPMVDELERLFAQIPGLAEATVTISGAFFA